MTSDLSEETRRTIADFGEQWTKYRDNPDYYGSSDLLADIFGSLLPITAVAGRRVVDIGSGTGRIVNMLLDAGAAHVVAVEPSAACAVLTENTRADRDRVTVLNVSGDRLPAEPPCELVVSIGVLHHVPDPDPVVAAAYRALVPGGRLLVWLYGHEGNETYLAFVEPLRRVTKRLPHPLLAALSEVLGLGLDLYIRLCRVLSLPMRSYMLQVLAKFPRRVRRLTIYDQLNPAYAKYYTREEAADLLARAGFTDIALMHRHGYSWTVTGTKPDAS
jgi:SAM-dependent methyltransferase